MATHRRDGRRQLLLGVLVGLAVMAVVVALALLVATSLLPDGRGLPSGLARGGSDTSEVEPRPTAVWRFRSEWLTPKAD